MQEGSVAPSQLPLPVRSQRDGEIIVWLADQSPQMSEGRPLLRLVVANVSFPLVPVLSVANPSLPSLKEIKLFNRLTLS